MSDRTLEEVVVKTESERLITHTNDEHAKVMADAVRAWMVGEG